MRIKRGVGRTRYQLQALFCPRCPLLVAAQRNVNVTSSFLFSWEGRTFLSTFRVSHLHLYLSTLLLRCFYIFWTRWWFWCWCGGLDDDGVGVEVDVDKGLKEKGNIPWYEEVLPHLSRGCVNPGEERIGHLKSAHLTWREVALELNNWMFLTIYNQVHINNI